MTLAERGRQAEILLVEDNYGDVILTRACLAAVGQPANLHHVENGEECLAFLRREGRYAAAVQPDIVLLDLNMPKMDGRETMAAIAADPDLCHLPVIVLTTSGAEEDLRHLYALGCTSYIVKSMDVDVFQRALEVLADYWFSVVRLPSGQLAGAAGA